MGGDGGSWLGKVAELLIKCGIWAVIFFAALIGIASLLKGVV